jgi:hypothetical protein
MGRPIRQSDFREADAADQAAGSAAPPAAGDEAVSIAAALRRCAAGDRGGLDELRTWQDGRLRAVLLRILQDPALTDRVLEAALDDLFRNAAMLEAIGRGPVEDRVFGLLRRHAYAALREGAPPAPLPPPPPSPVMRPRPTEEAPPTVQPPPPSPSAPAVAAEVPPPVADQPPPAMTGLRPGGVVTPLEPEPHPTRRPGLADPRRAEPRGGVDEDEEDDDDEAAAAPRRAWPRLVLAWLLAALAGFGVVYLAGTFLGLGPDVPSRAPVPARVEAPPPAAPPTAVPRSPAPPTAMPLPEPLGPPLEAEEPAGLDPSLAAPEEGAPPSPRPPAPPERSSEPDPPAAAAATPPLPAPQRIEPNAPPVPAEIRVFIHHSSGDDAVTGEARALAARLQERGTRTVIVRPVPFGIRGLSVRYFHDDDLAAARQTLAITRGLLGGAPDAPADFTAFTPPPRPGTIEVWLPGGGSGGG